MNDNFARSLPKAAEDVKQPVMRPDGPAGYGT